MKSGMCRLRFPLLLIVGWAAPPVKAQEFRPNSGPDPERISVTCDQLTLLLRKKSQWTPGRIDYRSHAMTTEASAYGTVFSFPEVGFIGTGHLENEPEDLRSLEFFLDGRKVESPSESLSGEIFRFERRSRIRNFRLFKVYELRENRLYESVEIETETEQELKLVYHFMHAWKPSVSAFLAGRDQDPAKTIVGELGDAEEINRKFFINTKVDWVAVFEPESAQFAVSRLLETPVPGGHVSMIWNVPGAYRKYYLKCFHNRVVPAGFQGRWRMVTAFGVSEPGEWEKAAADLAASLKE